MVRGGIDRRCLLVDRIDLKGDESMKLIEGIKLKPCPLCGSEAGMFINPGRVWSPAFAAKCLNLYCLCMVRGQTAEEAADKWNTRVPFVREGDAEDE